jgi:F0F1-type ATP synthase membrane subunit b/b'
MTDIVIIVISFALGVFLGGWWYQYQIKNHPEKLENWLDQIKSKQATVDSYFEEAITKVEDIGDKVSQEIREAYTDTAASAKALVGQQLIANLERAIESAKAKIKSATEKK